MAAPIRNAGSFRDPSGYVFHHGDDIIRSVNASAADSFGQVVASGIIDELVAKQWLIPTEVNPPQFDNLHDFRGARGEIPTSVLRHPRIPFISYPYEWTFAQLKDAALIHLDIQLAALAKGVVLSDATPFNMQFHNGTLLHMDVLSLRPYREGEPWVAYNQFCRLFLLPLLIEAWCGIPFQSLIRGRIEGVSFADAVRLLPRHKLWTSLNGIIHVALQARMIASASSSTAGKKTQAPHMSRNRYRAMLSELRNWISGLQSGRKAPTYWNDYATINSYSEEMRQVKEAFVAAWAAQLPDGSLWDVGGNTGEYSSIALKSGMQQAVVFDSDLDSLEKAYIRRKQEQPGLLPVLMDIADPSPGMGWNQAERGGLNERQRPDGIMALAVIHHMVIGRNLPLEAVVHWFVDTAPHGIIEFVPKRDPMVTQMLMHREDVFHDYDEEHFRQYLTARARITREHQFPQNGRVVFSYQRI